MSKHNEPCGVNIQTPYRAKSEEAKGIAELAMHNLAHRFKTSAPREWRKEESPFPTITNPENGTVEISLMIPVTNREEGARKIEEYSQSFLEQECFNGFRVRYTSAGWH